MSEVPAPVYVYLARLSREIAAHGGEFDPRTQAMVKERSRIVELLASNMPPPSITVTPEMWEKIAPLMNNPEAKRRPME